MVEKLFGGVEMLLEKVYLWIKVWNNSGGVLYGKFKVDGRIGEIEM